MQPVVKLVVKRVWQPVWQPCWTNSTVRSTVCQTGLYNRFDNRLYIRYNRLSNRLSNGFDNRLNVCIHDTTGSQNGLTTGLTTGVSCKRGFRHRPACKPAPVYTDRSTFANARSTSRNNAKAMRPFVITLSLVYKWLAFVMRLFSQATDSISCKNDRSNTSTEAAAL